MVKKILPTLVLISFLAVLIVPAAAFAIVPPVSTEKCTMSKNVGITECPLATQDCFYSDTTKPCGICCLLNTIYNVIDWIFVVLVAAAGLFIVMGAFTLLSSAGSAEGVKQGRDYILYAVIGLVVAFLARAIPALVKMIVGV